MDEAKPDELLLEMISRALDTCQEIHNDSRTPLDDAIKLAPLIRQLAEYKRQLRKEAFKIVAADLKYQDAVNKLRNIVIVVKAETIAHGQTMDFVRNASEATSAVLDLVIAIGAMVP